MEMSSPLAAMRPAPPVFGRKDIFGGHNAHVAPSVRGMFNDQFTFPRSGCDFFGVKPVHGSSPTASLAADLSQNFRINEASPLFPTPRRALFTGAGMMDAMEGREYITTPPLPASSPGISDMMDMSPLPHKAPYIAQIEIQTPTPVQTPTDDLMADDSPVPRQSSMEPGRPAGIDRRKLGLRRPSLTRAKAFSSSAVSTRTDPQLPSFRFGADRGLLNPPSSLSMTECFADSPPNERRPQSANSPTPAFHAGRAKPHFGSMSGLSHGHGRTGSPITSNPHHGRRTASACMRPRKQFRRSLSMFESPCDVMKAKPDASPAQPTLQAVMDIEEPQEPSLPHFFPEGQNDSIPRITRETMLEVLDGKYSEQYTQKLVIDCRFEYEYEGGHIDGAINYNDKELLATHLFRTPMEGRTLLIFHCEYSAHRAPIMARHIRAEDRTANAEFYPRLTYPEVYILEGGYSTFFTEHRNRCYPQAYVEMDDAGHINTCEREMGRLRQTRKGLNRAQTFAFGDDLSVQDSPTAPSRANTRGCNAPDVLAESPVFVNERAHARRMVSF